MLTDNFFRELIDDQINIHKMTQENLLKLFELYIQEQDKPAEDRNSIQRLIHMLEE